MPGTNPLRTLGQTIFELLNSGLLLHAPLPGARDGFDSEVLHEATAADIRQFDADLRHFELTWALVADEARSVLGQAITRGIAIEKPDETMTRLSELVTRCIQKAYVAESQTEADTASLVTAIKRLHGLAALTDAVWEESAVSECPKPPAARQLIKTASASQNPTHAADFGWVKCAHGDFTFTASQAAVVCLLWEDWEKGGLGLTGSYLLASAECHTERLKDLFRASAAWNTLIVAAERRGSFRLNLY